MARDYYQMLGVTRDASPEQIKNAYRQMAGKYHPDKHRNNPTAATTVLSEINKANAVLKDPKTRKIYDEFGLEGITAFESINTHLGALNGGASAAAEAERAFNQWVTIKRIERGWNGGGSGNTHTNGAGASVHNAHYQDGWAARERAARARPNPHAGFEEVENALKAEKFLSGGKIALMAGAVIAMGAVAYGMRMHSEQEKQRRTARGSFQPGAGLA